MGMHEQMRDELLALAKALAKSKNWQLSTVSLRAYGKADFFDNLAKDKAGKGTVSFSARKYDEVLKWFADNWPSDKAPPWPEGVKKP